MQGGTRIEAQALVRGDARRLTEPCAWNNATGNRVLLFLDVMRPAGSQVHARTGP